MQSEMGDVSESATLHERGQHLRRYGAPRGHATGAGRPVGMSCRRQGIALDQMVRSVSDVNHEAPLAFEHA